MPYNCASRAKQPMQAGDAQQFQKNLRKTLPPKPAPSVGSTTDSSRQASVITVQVFKISKKAPHHTRCLTLGCPPFLELADNRRRFRGVRGQCILRAVAMGSGLLTQRAPTSVTLSQRTVDRWINPMGRMEALRSRLTNSHFGVAAHNNRLAITMRAR